VRQAFGPRLLQALAAAAIVTTGLDSQTPQQPTFSGRVEVVRVDALVTDGKQVVRGLRAADFEVLDNGIPQQIQYVSFEQLPLNVIMVLDTSDSLSGERLVRLQAAGQAVIDGLERQDQSALIRFNHVVSIASLLGSDRNPVRAAIRGITAGGGTALFDAVHTGMVLGDADVGRTLVVVFTDGTDTSSFLTHEAVLETASRSDAVVYAAVVGRRTEFLTELTRRTGGAVIEVKSTANLTDVFVDILQQFRQRYLLGYSPSGVERGGWHQIDVRVKGRRVSVTARAGYQSGR
jgi:Ca-activated chloride channel homolog